MGRMFVDPATGDMHPESYYRMENVDLDTVLEAFEIDGVFGFDIRVENIERMDIRHPAVIEIFALFVASLLEMSMKSEDPDEREKLEAVAIYVSKLLIEKETGRKVSH